MGNFKMKIEKKIGKRTYEFTVEGENLYEAIAESKKLSFYDVHKCGCCQSEDLILDAHLAQGRYKYATVKCNGCKASVNFGQQQESPDIFYLKTRNKADNSGKEIDWKAAPAPQGQAPQGQAPQGQAPQQVAQQQVQNYSQPQQPNNGQPRQ